VQPVYFVPRRAYQQASSVLHDLLEKATAALAAEIGDEAAEFAQLLCRNAGGLLFRRAASAKGDAEA
jgi:hypothetical protein